MPSTTTNLYVSRLTDDAKLPTKGTPLSAGYDLYASEDVNIPPFSKKMVSTGVAMTVPEGTYGRVAPRSGLAHKNSIDVLAGVIDRGYTGEVKVILMNLSNETQKFPKHTRIAQLVLEKIENAEVKEVFDLTTTIKSDRGSGGFGSTGM